MNDAPDSRLETLSTVRSIVHTSWHSAPGSALCPFLTLDKTHFDPKISVTATVDRLFGSFFFCLIKLYSQPSFYAKEMLSRQGLNQLSKNTAESV